jgi:hypothetical protein
MRDSDYLFIFKFKEIKIFRKYVWYIKNIFSLGVIAFIFCESYSWKQESLLYI